MPQENKDASLKKQVIRLLDSCGLEDLKVDREVHLNFSGAKDDDDRFEDEKEIDVIAKFSYAGKVILLFFECEDSVGSSGSIKAEYRDYDGVIKKMRTRLDKIEVLHSRDHTLHGIDFRDVDELRRPTIYGTQMAERISRDLASRGLTIVSGLARGIDAISH